MKITFVLLLLAAIVFASSTSKVVNLSSFSWQTCSDDVTTTIHYAKVYPDPILIPGTISVDVNATATEDLNSPATLHLLMERLVSDQWVELPCSSHFGTCTYPDFCPMLDVVYPPTQPCPPQFQTTGTPCRCPFPAGEYYIHGLTMHLNIDVPGAVLDGDYHLRFNFTSKEVQVTCFEVFVTMMAAP